MVHHPFVPSGPHHFVSSVSDEHDGESSDDEECVPHESVAMAKVVTPAVNHGQYSSHVSMDSDSDDESTTATSMSCVSHASHDSHDARTPGPSCVKGSAAYRGVDRSGNHLRFYDDVDVSCFEPEGEALRRKKQGRYPSSTAAT